MKHCSNLREAHSYSDRKDCYTSIFFASIAALFSQCHFVFSTLMMYNSLIIVVQDDTSHETRERKHFHLLNHHSIQCLPHHRRQYHRLSLWSCIYGSLMRSCLCYLSEVRYAGEWLHLVSWYMMWLCLIRREKTKQLFKLSFYVLFWIIIWK